MFHRDAETILEIFIRRQEDSIIVITIISRDLDIWNVRTEVGNYFFSGLVFCYFKEVNQLMARLVKYQRQNLSETYMIVVLEGLNGTDCT